MEGSGQTEIAGGCGLGVENGLGCVSVSPGCQCS